MDRSIADLSIEEKIKLAEELWDEIAAHAQELPPQWQIDEVERRKGRLRANPASGLTWEEVKKRVRERHGG